MATAEEVRIEFDAFIATLVRRSRWNCAFIGIFGTAFGIAMGAGGARNIKSLIVQSTWPLFVISGLLCLAWSIKPTHAKIVTYGGWLASVAWGSRAILAIVWGINNNKLFTATCVFVVSSHIMVCQLLYTMWLIRIAPVAKNAEQEHFG